MVDGLKFAEPNIEVVVVDGVKVVEPNIEVVVVVVDITDNGCANIDTVVVGTDGCANIDVLALVADVGVDA